MNNTITCHDTIDNMNHAITCHDISSDNILSISIIINLDTSFSSFYETNFFSTDGSYWTSGDSSSSDFGSDNMSHDNSFGLIWSQALQGTSGQFGKSVIRRSKNSQGFSTFESVYQSKVGDNLD